MTILQINNAHYKYGGAEAVYINTIQLLKDNGHKVIPFSLMNENNIPSEFDDFFVDTKSYKHNKFFSFETFQNLFRLIDRIRPDIVHIHNFIGGITTAALTAIKKANIPIILSMHGFRSLCPAHVFIDAKGEICEECKFGNYSRCIIKNCSPDGLAGSFLSATESYFRNLLFPFDKYVDEYIFVSKFVQNKYLETNDSLREKSFQVYNFTNKFKFNDFRGDYFLFFGRLSREKGLLTLLRAFEDIPNINLKIAGDGELFEVIKNKKLQNIELLGYQKGQELENTIKNASFIIVPSECYETNSMTTVEAFAMGKPVIASNIGALPELILHGQNGYLFEPKNHHQLSDLVVELSTLSVDRYSRLSESAYRFALENFSEENYYNKLIEIYKYAIERKGLKQ